MNIGLNTLSSAAPATMPFFVLFFIAGTVIVHLAFGASVFVDARRLRNSNTDVLAMAGPLIWTLAVLLGGVFVAAAYWLVHHSAIRK